MVLKVGPCTSGTGASLPNPACAAHEFFLRKESCHTNIWALRHDGGVHQTQVSFWVRRLFQARANEVLSWQGMRMGACWYFPWVSAIYGLPMERGVLGWRCVKLR